MSHIWMSHVTHMNESCHTYEGVMSHMWMSHVTHTGIEAPHRLILYKDESTHESTYEWVILSYHTYEWVISHIWMSHITHMNESCMRAHTI